LIDTGQLGSIPEGKLDIDSAILPLPKHVQEITLARTLTLGEKHRQVLAAAAIIGRRFEPFLLRRISGQPEPELFSIVEQLMERGFFREVGIGLSKLTLDFQHDYIRRAIYEDTSAVQRQALHLRAAKVLEEIHQTKLEEVLEDIAYHLEKVGDYEAVPYLVRAAERAENLYAYTHSIDLYSRALTLHRAHYPDERERQCELMLAREALLDYQGRREEQALEINTLIDLAQTNGSPKLQAQIYVRQAGFLAYTGRFTEARHAGERAMHIFRTDGDQMGEARTLQELGFIHWKENDFSTALAYNRSALDLYRRLGDIEGEASSLHNLAEIHRGLGSPSQALAMYERAMNLHWARGALRAQSLSLYGMAHAYRQVGQHEPALQRYQQALSCSQKSGDRLMVSRVHHALAYLRWATGAQQEAVEHMQKALEISQQIGYGPGIAYGLIALGYFYSNLGDIRSAQTTLQEAQSWLQLIEDYHGLENVQSQLSLLEKGSLTPLPIPPTMAWFKSHVALAEGKVYCEFESPMSKAIN